MTSFNITRKLNKIIIEGKILDLFFLPFVLLRIHNAITKRGFTSIELDFSKCEALPSNGMLALCAQVAKYREDNIDFFLTKPSKPSLSKLFDNAGWSNLIDSSYQVSPYKGTLRIPATTFKTDDDQFTLVNNMMNAVLASIHWSSREDLAALEWAINEITDNVLVHSKSTVGGIAQLTVFPKSQHIQLDVCDTGVSIPHTFPKHEDYEALSLAIQEGVKGASSIGKGNGLFGSFQICEKSGGEFHIYSNFGHLMLVKKRNAPYSVRMINEKVPFRGTLVSARINCSTPHVLTEALKLGGSLHKPMLSFDNLYGEEKTIIFNIKKEARSCGSRNAGIPVRKKIENLLELYEDKIILIDFEDLSIISSSFADEVIAKLYSSLGKDTFTKKVKLINITDLIYRLIQREINQRS